MNSCEFDKALTKAKIGLMISPNTIFFATLVFNMVHKEDNSIPTAATNGKSVKYNSDFFMNLSKEERVFLIAHEAMHAAYKHMDRKGDKEHQRWNAACDYVINYHLVQAGFTMPSTGLYDIKYAGMSADQIYLLLEDDAECPMMDLEDGVELSAEDSTAIDGILVQAAMMADKVAAGNVPGDIRTYVDSLLKPKLPWQSILRRYMRDIVKNDYSFTKPNKRYLPMYLPTLRSESSIDLVIAVDASGSVIPSEFLRYISEIAGIFKSIKPKKITVIAFDTKIRSIAVIKQFSDIKKIDFNAGGGTDIYDVIEYINEHKPTITLFFTDGGFRFNNHSKQPIIWLINDNKGFVPQYGKAIHFTT